MSMEPFLHSAKAWCALSI